MERLGHREISQLLRKIEDVCLVKVEHVIKQVDLKTNALQEVLLLRKEKLPILPL